MYKRKSIDPVEWNHIVSAKAFCRTRADVRNDYKLSNALNETIFAMSRLVIEYGVKVYFDDDIVEYIETDWGYDFNNRFIDDTNMNELTVVMGTDKWNNDAMCVIRFHLPLHANQSNNM